MSDTDKSKKRKRGTTPSSEDAALAISTIKALEKENNEDLLKKKKKEEEFAQQQEQQRTDRERITIAEERVKRKLRENLEKKLKIDKQNKVKDYLEKSDNKIKWKSLSGGNRLEGYIEDKLFFEIKRGLNLFTLYLKNEKLMKDKKLKSYQGCSMIIQKLKDKSNKFI